MQHLEGSGTPGLYIGRTVLEGKYLRTDCPGICRVRFDTCSLCQQDDENVKRPLFDFRVWCKSSVSMFRCLPLTTSWKEKLKMTSLLLFHHHKHQGLDPLIRSVSRVTTVLSNVSSVSQLLFFLVVCSDMISKGFGLVTLFASVNPVPSVSVLCFLWRFWVGWVVLRMDNQSFTE